MCEGSLRVVCGVCKGCEGCVMGMGGVSTCSIYSDSIKYGGLSVHRPLSWTMLVCLSWVIMIISFSYSTIASGLLSSWDEPIIRI